MGELWRRLGALLRRRRMDRELERELQFHLEMKAAAEGDAARARRAVGNPLALRERGRDVWGWTWLDELFRDGRLALRGMKRSPGFSAAAIATLALGIAANTLMFSVVDATVLRPFPFPEPERLVQVWESTKDSPRVPPRPEVYDALRRNNDWLDLAADASATFDLDGEPYPEKVAGKRATASYLDVLGVQPAVGRFFTPAEQDAGRDHVLLISEQLWRSRYKGDPGVIGSALRLVADEEAGDYTIIGVMPDAVQTLSRSTLDIWLPFDPQRHAVGRNAASVTGRLKPGVSMEAAEAAAKARVEALGLIEEKELVSASLTPKIAGLTQGDVRTMRLLGLAVTFVLLIACAGVANLMLARGAERVKELGIRVAIGAGRARMFRQLLSEALALGLAGGAAGTLIAFLSVGGVRGLVPENMLRRDLISLDLRALLFTVAVTLLASLLFGLLPALKAARADVRPVLAGVRGGGRERTRLRSALIVGEIALALVLVTGAGLMMQSLRRLIAPERLGFQSQNVITLRPIVPRQILADGAARFRMQQEIETRLRALPGVRSVGLADTRPLGSGYMNFRMSQKGSEVRRVGTWLAVSPDYFDALGIQVLGGRPFRSSDRLGSPPVAIVSELGARQYWPVEDAIGQRIATPDPQRTGETEREVVGVVRNTAGGVLELPPMAMVYVPYAQAAYWDFLEIMVRVEPGVSTAALIPAIRTELASVNRALAVEGARGMEEVVSSKAEQPRFLAIVLGAFAGLALVLTVIGVGGVTAYLVRARTYEFGVRMALGAAPGNILKLILRFGGRLALTGVVLGTAGAVAASRLLESYLFEVKPLDWPTMTIAPVVVIAVVLGACCVPARRAMRIDAARSLRQD